MAAEKKKAKELIEKFNEMDFRLYGPRNWDMAKQCALICVDEILEELGHIDQNWPESVQSRASYWQSVKQQILLI